MRAPTSQCRFPFVTPEYARYLDVLTGSEFRLAHTHGFYCPTTDTVERFDVWTKAGVLVTFGTTTWDAWTHIDAPHLYAELEVGASPDRLSHRDRKSYAQIRKNGTTYHPKGSTRLVVHVDAADLDGFLNSIGRFSPVPWRYAHDHHFTLLDPQELKQPDLYQRHAQRLESLPRFAREHLGFAMP